jgi:hypothetical protein
MATKKSKWVVRLLTISGIVLLLIVGVFLTRGTPVNCWRWAIDLNSGRLRASRVILGFSIKERFEKSEFFSVINTNSPVTEAPIWKTMQLDRPDFIPTRDNSMNGFLDQIHVITVLWGQNEFSPAAQKLIALRLLDAWKHGESLSSTRKYTKAVQTWLQSFPNERVIGETDVQEFHNSISKE